jgi:dynein heavy chain
LYSCVWAIGASFEEDCRQGFHQFIMKLLACNDVVEIFGIETNKTPFEPRAYKLKLNDPDNIYNITYDVTKGIWINWMQTIPKYQVPKEAQFHELIIPTIESLRTSNFFNLLVKNSKHILFTGLTGTGKTISILNELNLNYFNDDYSFLATCFSGQT